MSNASELRAAKNPIVCRPRRQELVPDAGTILDISKWNKTATPAGSRGPIISEGDHLIEQDNPGVAVQFMGNNQVLLMENPCDPAKHAEIVAKFRRKGMNLLRIHHWEEYWMDYGSLYGSSVNQPGDFNLNPVRLQETDQFLALWRADGGYYTFGPASQNMLANMGTRNRYDYTPLTGARST